MNSQLQLIQSSISTNSTSGNDNTNNTKLAQTHAMEAIALLNQEIAERNQRIARILPED
jgi:hypothetical protein